MNISDSPPTTAATLVTTATSEPPDQRTPRSIFEVLASIRLLTVMIMIMMLLQSAAAQAPDLPATKGRNSIGTHMLWLTDSNREETWTPSPNDRRRLVVQIWYPSAEAKSQSRAPYVPEYAALASDLEKYMKDADDLLGSRTTAAAMDAPIAVGRFPLVVFSHGMNSARYFHTALIEDIASKGYIVAAIDHTYWGPGEAFPDGRAVHFMDGMPARDALTSDQIDELMQDGVHVMAADQSFVIETLLQAGSFISGHVDGNQVGAIGHSMGGMAALRACLDNPIIKACVSLDGLVWARDGNTSIGQPATACAKPILLLLAPQFLPPNLSVFAKRFTAGWEHADVLLLEHARHNSFTDFGFLRSAANLPPDTIPALRAHEITSAVLSAFLDKNLRHLSVQLPQFPELVVLSLQKLATDKPGIR